MQLFLWPLFILVWMSSLHKRYEPLVMYNKCFCKLTFTFECLSLFSPAFSPLLMIGSCFREAMASLKPKTYPLHRHTVALEFPDIISIPSYGVPFSFLHLCTNSHLASVDQSGWVTCIWPMTLPPPPVHGLNLFLKATGKRAGGCAKSNSQFLRGAIISLH